MMVPHKLEVENVTVLKGKKKNQKNVTTITEQMMVQSHKGNAEEHLGTVRVCQCVFILAFKWAGTHGPHPHDGHKIELSALILRIYF